MLKVIPHLLRTYEWRIWWPFYQQPAILLRPTIRAPEIRKSSQRSGNEQNCSTWGRNLLDTLKREDKKEKKQKELARWPKVVCHPMNWTISSIPAFSNLQQVNKNSENLKVLRWYMETNKGEDTDKLDSRSVLILFHLHLSLMSVSFNLLLKAQLGSVATSTELDHSQSAI